MGRIWPMASPLRARRPMERGGGGGRGGVGLPCVAAERPSGLGRVGRSAGWRERCRACAQLRSPRTACTRWVRAHRRPARGKVFTWSTGVERGRRRARMGPVGLTEDFGRRRGGARGFERRRSMVAGELWWSAVMMVWSYSSEEEGRGEAAP
jgi:hypothetical protein